MKNHKRIVAEIKNKIVEVFQDDLEAILLYGSSLSESKTPNDTDIIIILRKKEKIKYLLKVKDYIKKLNINVDLQIVRLDDISKEGFSHDTHGEFIIYFLKKAKVLYGKNPFLDIGLDYSSLVVSVKQKMQYYYFRAKKILINNEDSGLIIWEFHKKKLSLMLFDFYFLLTGRIEDEISNKDFLVFLTKNFKTSYNNLISALDLKDVKKYQDIFSLYNKIYYSILEKLDINTRREIMCHEDIYTELYINNNNKLAIICSGLPSNYDESNLIKYLGINNYDTLSFHYRNTGLSGGLIFDPKSDIENLIDFYSKKYASITLFVNSFAASPVMDLKSETVLKLSKIIFVSPAFNLSKVSDIKTLPDFIEAHKKYMYRFTSDFFTKFIYIDKTKIVNKLNCKVFVIHGKDDKQITMDSVEKLQKKIGFELIKVKEGHMSFNKLVKYHLDILYDLL